jgi:uncharacterized protein (DUF1684 family)
MTVAPRFRCFVPRRSCATTLALAAALAGVVACSGGSPAESYADRLLADRAAKDRMFRGDPASPLLPADRATFQHLAYFPIDEAYRVPASLQVLTQDAGNAIKMPTSTGQMRDMVRIGYLEFVLKGQPLKLAAFTEAGAPLDRLFVPFADRTTGTETYAGGRYLDLDRTATGLYDLDFNRAYHPYCFYNPEYDCPYPPPENRLPLPVRAGERIPQ